MNEVGITAHDETVMKLLHYFITEQGYNPIMLQGAKNEIWLESLDHDYRIVRIVTDYIHNDEQLKFDMFKTTKISKRIKKKLMSFKMNVLCFYLNLGDNVSLDDSSERVGKITCVPLHQFEDIKRSQAVLDSFPTIADKTDFKEEGMELFIKLTREINAKNEQDAKTADEVFQNNKPIVTYALIFINVILFFLMYLLGQGSTHVGTLLAFGANWRPLVLAGEVWRLLTSTFLHIGVLHFMVNMYALYVIGPQLENFFGKAKYLLIYLFSAFCGSLLSICFSSHISAGASGAIFGLLGALLYFGYHYRIYLGNVMKSQIIPIILLNLIVGFMLPGIDNAAHIGGVVAGLFAAMAVGVKYKSTAVDRMNGFIVSMIYVAFLIYMGFMV